MVNGGKSSISVQPYLYELCLWTIFKDTDGIELVVSNRQSIVVLAKPLRFKGYLAILYGLVTRKTVKKSVMV